MHPSDPNKQTMKEEGLKPTVALHTLRALKRKMKMMINAKMKTFFSKKGGKQ